MSAHVRFMKKHVIPGAHDDVLENYQKLVLLLALALGVVSGSWMIPCLLVAVVNVTSNDFPQVGGTFICCQKDKMSWQMITAIFGFFFVLTMIYGWVTYDQQIDFGLLKTKAPDRGGVHWYHLLPLIALQKLTQKGIPVSTSTLALGMFLTEQGFHGMVEKSFVGFVFSMLLGMVVWVPGVWLDHKLKPKKWFEGAARQRVLLGMQIFSTMFLWGSWLIMDMANIAVFAVPKLEWWQLALFCAYFIFSLSRCIKAKGGKIQEIINEKTGTQYIFSAFIIDLIYGCILYAFKVFKVAGDLPMSTTWVFVGLMLGREAAIRIMLAYEHQAYKAEKSFPIIIRDNVARMLIGFVASLVLLIPFRWDVVMRLFDSFIF